MTDKRLSAGYNNPPKAEAIPSVKLKNLPLLLFPFRRPGRRYGYVVAGTECGGVRIARWLHPREQPKRLTAAVAEEYKKYIAAGDFCIDIGAHSGDSTLPMAVAAGRTGLVLALEPNPFVYPALEKNARMNRGLVNIHPVMAAAAAADAPLLFNYSDAGFCNGGGHAKINAARHGHFYPLEVHGIDLAAELRESFAGELARLKFIKVDTEGGDLFVLQSLAEIIERRRPQTQAKIRPEQPGAVAVRKNRRGKIKSTRRPAPRTCKTHHNAPTASGRPRRAFPLSVAHRRRFCKPCSLWIAKTAAGAAGNRARCACKLQRGCAGGGAQ